MIATWHWPAPPAEGNRTKGRPRTTWWGTMEKEREAMGWWSKGVAGVSAEDRIEWRCSVKVLCTTKQQTDRYSTNKQILARFRQIKLYFTFILVCTYTNHIGWVGSISILLAFWPMDPGSNLLFSQEGNFLIMCRKCLKTISQVIPSLVNEIG